MRHLTKIIILGVIFGLSILTPASARATVTANTVSKQVATVWQDTATWQDGRLSRGILSVLQAFGGASGNVLFEAFTLAEFFPDGSVRGTLHLDTVINGIRKNRGSVVIIGADGQFH